MEVPLPSGTQLSTLSSPSSPPPLQLLPSPPLCAGYLTKCLPPNKWKRPIFCPGLSSLTAVLEESVLEEYHDVPIYVRGDADVNPSNLPRSQLFSNFLTRFKLRNFPSITQPDFIKLHGPCSQAQTPRIRVCQAHFDQNHAIFCCIYRQMRLSNINDQSALYI